ncbi:DUF5752 family protein [Chlamydiota bacterium]
MEASKGFLFTECVEIKELLGTRAKDELELMDRIEEIPADSIYYHTHSYFLRHSYIVESYPNDFANWVSIQIRDPDLGERLGAITPWGHKTLEDLREEFLEIIDEHLASTNIIGFAPYAKPFFFMKSRIIKVPTDICSETLTQFRDALKVIDASGLYNHIFEARLRLERGKSDFSIWLREVICENDLANEIETIDWYMYSLEEIRRKLIDLCNKKLIIRKRAR